MFQTTINQENKKNITLVLILLIIFEALVLGYELINHGVHADYSGTILYKLAIVLIAAIFLALLSRIPTIHKGYRQLIGLLTIVFFGWSVLNVFAAQSVLADMSVLILSLSVVSAIVIFDYRFTAVLYTCIYIAFALGIPYFQPDPTFVLAFRINGAIITVFMWFISAKLFTTRRKIHDQQVAIEGQNAEIKASNKKLQNILDFTGEGYIAFGEDLVVQPECSQYSKDLFGPGIVGQSAMCLLSDSEEEVGFMEKVFASIFKNDSSLQVTAYMDLLPTQRLVNGSLMNIHYKYVGPEEDADLALILVTFQDISYVSELEKGIQSERVFINQIIQMVTSHDTFVDLLTSFNGFIKSPMVCEGQIPCQEQVIRCQRELHTFKGDFLQYGLKGTAEKIHDFELRIRGLHKDQGEAMKAVFGDMSLVNWDQLVWADTTRIRDLIGDDILDLHKKFTITEEQIGFIENIIEQRLPKDEHTEVLAMLDRIREITLDQLIVKKTQAIEHLSHEYGKQVKFTFDAHRVVYDDDYHGKVIRNLIHVYKNTVVHGIETMDQRVQMGKEAHGTVHTTIRQEEGLLTIQIEDDGQGIDVLFDKQESESLEAPIFDHGVSTAERATMNAGMGMGLASVKDCVETLGGAIKVQSEPIKGTCFIIQIPMERSA